MTVESGDEVFESVDEFIARLEQRWGERPWHDRLRLRARRRWSETWRARLEPRYAWQRARRGYSERDTWDLHHHLANVIVGGLTRMRERDLGHPAKITAEKWNLILDTIVGGFTIYLEKDWSERTDDDHYAVERAKQALMLYFEDLWD